MVSWEKPIEVAFRHRAGIAETSYKRLRVVWNSSLSRRSKLRIFQSVFLSTLTYGLETLTQQDKFFKKVDPYYIRFLRRIVGIKASFYPRITNHTVWQRAGYPRKPSISSTNSFSRFSKPMTMTQSRMSCLTQDIKIEYRRQVGKGVEKSSTG